MFLAGPVATAVAQQVGSAPVRGVIVLNAPDLILPKHTLAARHYRLGPLGADEIAHLRTRNAEQKFLHVGIGRSLPAGVSAGVALDALAWHALPDGSRVTTVEFASPDAAALRVSLDIGAFPPGLTVRTYAAATDGPLHGAVDAATLAGGSRIHWLPEQPGEVLGIELHAAAGADLRGEALPVRQLLHLVAMPLNWNAKRLDGLGNAESCNIDVACAGSTWVEAGRAVAKFIFTFSDPTPTNPDRVSAGACTGTLLNNLGQDGTPYFITANHCILDAERAANMTFYWHFERVLCGGADPTDVIQTTGGAVRHAESAVHDMVLLQLHGMPPVTAALAGWSANTPVRNASGVGLHHPGGDVKKVSRGTTSAFTQWSESVSAHSHTAPYLRVLWSEGTTQQGSSGSALFSADGARVIGTLRGGLASCDASGNPDYYGRFDQAYPQFTAWLGGTPPAPVPDPDPPQPAPQPAPGGGGGHGGLLLLAMAWLFGARRSIWITPSNSCATQSGRRSLPMPR